MKKLISVLLAAIMTLSLCSCTFNFNESSKVGDETSSVNSGEQTQSPNAQNNTSTKFPDEAKAAYAAKLAEIHSTSPITSALITDLDLNGIPEIITVQGEMADTVTLLSYGRTSGLALYEQRLHSSTPADIMISDSTEYIYFSDSGHNLSTAWIHEAVCFKATDDGLLHAGNVTGDSWDDVDNELINSDTDLYQQTDSRYDAVYQSAIEDIVGNGSYTNFYDICISENTVEYLNTELSIDIISKVDEYNAFCDNAKRIASEKAGAQPVKFFAGDFDRNGSYEAFALCGAEVSNQSDYTVTRGSLVFVNSNNEAYTICSDDFGSDFGMYTLAYHDYLVTAVQPERFFEYSLYTVDNLNANEIIFPEGREISDFSAMSPNGYSNTLVVTEKIYNTYTVLPGDTDGSVASFQNYFFFDTADGLKEYAAIEITEQQFRNVGGGRYLDILIGSEYTINNILYRDNGTFVVNYYQVSGNDSYVNKNIIFKKTVNSVYPISADGFGPEYVTAEDSDFGNDGTCRPVFNNAIAVYPDQFPY